MSSAIMTLSQFRVELRKDHFDRIKFVYSYFKKFYSSSIRVRVDMPDYYHFPDYKHS